MPMLNTWLLNINPQMPGTGVLFLRPLFGKVQHNSTMACYILIYELILLNTKQFFNVGAFTSKGKGCKLVHVKTIQISLTLCSLKNDVYA